MKIAFMGIKGLPSKSGTERVAEAIIARLKNDFEITVYCDSQYTPAETTYEGVRLVRIRTLKGKYLRPVSLGIFSALHALFWGNYDVIHMHGVENCFTLPLLRWRSRIISTSHGTPGRMPISKWSPVAHFLMKLTEYPFMYLSNCPTTISEPDTNYLAARYKKTPVYIPNGVDIDLEIARDAAQTDLTRLGLMPQNFILFIAGRIIPRKGCHLLLEALRKVKSGVPLLVIGDLNQSPAYTEQLRALANQQNVTFLRPIENKRHLFGILALCKLFVFPSTAEGMSLMLLEAASLGIPMLCSDIPENVTVLSDKVTYFRSGDSDDLAEKLQWALEHVAQIAQQCHVLSGWVKANYSWDVLAQKYKIIYQQVAKGQVVAQADLERD